MSFGGGYDNRGGGNSSVMKVDSNSVGKIIGRGGSNIRNLEQQSNARIKIGREEDDFGKKEIEISGEPDEVQAAKDMIEDCLNSEFQGGRQGGGGFGGRDRNGGYGRRDDGGGSRYGRRDDGERWGRRERDDYGGDRGGPRRQQNYGGESGGDQETIFVDSSEVGRIIGRGGTRIREMEADSGCRIKVSRDGDSQGRSSVDLSGSKGQISKAKQAIQDAGVDIGEDRGRGW